MRSICQLTASHTYHLYMEFVDMRKSFQGLQGLIHASFGRYVQKVEDTEKAYTSEITKVLESSAHKQQKKESYRQRYAAPAWRVLQLWCMNHILEVPDDTLIYKAMNYVLRHYAELTGYLDIAEMPIDNNDTERSIRDMVMGKKAYLFCQNDLSCSHAAEMYSFFGACKVLGKNPEHWLTYALKHINTWPKDRLEELLPENWAEDTI